MSCNGCRVLRKGCSESCILRPCLQWIESPESQAHATLFVAKFFGRSDLMSFISAVPDNQKPAVFQSLLLEACGRTVNPVNGAVGLLWTGNWHVCQSAVNAVLCGGTLSPMLGNLPGNLPLDCDESSENFRSAWTAVDSRSPSQAGYIGDLSQIPRFSKKILAERNVGGRKRFTTSANSEEQSSSMTSFEGGDENHNKLLNLFV